MKLIRPIIDRNRYHEPIQKLIYKQIYDYVYNPLFEILLIKPSRENASQNMLLSYLRSGKLTYEGNLFKGKLNATISKQLRDLGAKWNKTSKGYSIPGQNLPMEIKIAIVEGNQRNKEKFKRIDDFLKATEGRKLPELNLEAQFSKTIDDLNKQFEQTTKKIIPGDIAIEPAPHQIEKLKQSYAENLEKYIQGWHDEAILRLRSKIMENTLQGFRAEELIGIIQNENRVSYNKAKFLAKQETSLLVSQYRKERYQENGLDWYMWSTSHDERVRSSHRVLNNQYFRFSDPPVTNPHTMQRNNPGEDFGCRCVAIPVISDHKEMQLNLRKGATK